MADDDEKSPAGEALRENIRRIREEKRLTYVELAEKLASPQIRRPIPVLGLRRIERGERRVDVDDLLAIAQALKVAPVDLLVPNTLDDSEPFKVAPELTATAGEVREWIGGGILPAPTGHADLAEAFRWMPKTRARELASKWLATLGLTAETGGARGIPVEPGFYDSEGVFRPSTQEGGTPE